jgi:hypothetical protein
MNASILNRLNRKGHQRTAKRGSKKSTRGKSGPRSLHLDSLEKREMFSVSSLYMHGDMLIVQTDNAATAVEVSQSGSNIRVDDVTTNRSWDIASGSVGSVAFVGGAGNDAFANNVANLRTVAIGNGGNDYLRGAGAADTLVGGAGHDTLVGNGGNDVMWGGEGNDVLLGGDGHDWMTSDHGNDIIAGGAGNDVLLGGAGDDYLFGEAGNDRLFGHAGNDRHYGGAGNDVIVSIDGAFGDFVDSGDGVDTVWIDRVGYSPDSFVGSSLYDMVQEVASFANGADRTLDGDRIADPTAGYRYQQVANAPLFSNSGPQMTDVYQGQVGDCWALAGLSAIARDNPQAIRHNVVDFGDGTYGVRLGNNFYRVDNDLPVAPNGQLAYAKLGADNSMWVAIVEKAFAHYRTGANNYASLNNGWSIDVNRAFRSASAGRRQFTAYSSAAELANDIAYRSDSGQAVTVAVMSDRQGRLNAALGAPLIMNHQYTVASVQRNSVGAVVSITLRNPWGFDGSMTRDASPNDGFVTVAPDQLFAHLGEVNWGRV